MSLIRQEIDDALSNMFLEPPAPMGECDVVIILNSEARHDFYRSVRGLASYRNTGTYEEYRGARLATWNGTPEQRVGVYVRRKSAKAEEGKHE